MGESVDDAVYQLCCCPESTELAVSLVHTVDAGRGGVEIFNELWTETIPDNLAEDQLADLEGERREAHQRDVARRRGGGGPGK